MATNSINSVWPVVIGGLMVIGIASFFAYQYVQKKKKSHKLGCSKNRTNNITIEFTLRVKYFSGNMNALRNISLKPDLSLAKITFDNIQKTIEVKGTDEIKSWYYEFGKDRNSWDVILYKNKAKEILNILIRCGVHSHEEKEFIWNNECSKKYNKLSQVQSGQECMVVAPYWIYNGDIFEKGLVKAK